MTVKFTPGPWSTEGATLIWSPTAAANIAQVGELHATGVVGHTPANYKSPDFEEIVANACLIAAAPDLFKVAQFFLLGIEGGHIKCAPYIDFDPDAEDLDIKSPADRLREVLAKAAGETDPMCRGGV